VRSFDRIGRSFDDCAMSFRAPWASASFLAVALAAGCGSITFQSPDGGDGAAGTTGGGGGSGAAPDGGADVATAGSGGTGGSSGGTGGSSGGTGGSSGGTGGASGGTGGASGGTGGASGGTGGASGSTGGASGATGGTGGGGADGGVDASDGGGAETRDAAPTCDGGFALDGGTCVPIVVVIGSTAPCAGGGNVMYFDGDSDNFIFKGKQTVTLGKWSATSSATQVHVHVDPTDTTTQGLWWDLYFDSSKLSSPLAPQVYTDAMRWPFQTTGHPGLDVSGDGRGCNMVTGRFQIEDLTTSDNGLKSFTATFEHHCEGNASAVRGCVHFEM
jgi:hypothetical protein